MPIEPAQQAQLHGQILNQGKLAPTAQAPTMSAPPENETNDSEGEGDVDSDIVAGLEEHLNSLKPEQQAYLVQAIDKDPETMINVLGLVCGPEVGQYFTDIYKQYIQQQEQQAPAQPNSGQPAPQAQAQPNSGPIQPAQPSKQQQATPAPQPGMAP